MTLRTSLVRTAAFAALYAVATLAGRMTVMSGSRLALVWPAAGVAVLWLCAQRRASARWVDLTVLTAIVLVGNAVTGTGAALGVVLAVANLVQALVFVGLLGRRRPKLWGGGRAWLSTPRELGCVLGIAVVSGIIGTAIASTGLWLFTGQTSWLSFAAGLARTVAGTFVIGTAGLWFGQALSQARHHSVAGWRRAADRALRATPRWRVAEYLAVALCSAGGYLIGFVYDDGLPLAFPLIVVTVWAAMRLRTSFVVLHYLGMGTAAVLFTLHGDGPMATIADPQLRALFAQAYVVLIAAVGLALALGRDERATLMSELAAQKDELAAQKEQGARHSALLSSIIDSMADGLSVIDADGRVVLRNPAAQRLLGRPAPATMAGEVRDRLRHLDGTPITAEDLPYARALAGEHTDPVDLLFGDPRGRDARVIQVTATALPDRHGTRSAVVLLHDVTAERRERDELAGFAGVVAHDLLNPLTTVEGWTGVAVEALDAGPEPPAVERARGGLVRVARASARMRGLITDLLAYTAARDADLAPGQVDLTALVADIAYARTDAAATGDNPIPRFTMDELDAVYADAVGVRQMLDNLISNAIKYTAPGVTPHLTITSTRTAGTVQVTITDNGIGIPAGQHEAIFDNFHRAHRGSGYTGTGLGLAICQRIVTRHGGTITADDNPGGGSRFTFTLPAAGLPVTAAPTGARRVAALI
jgi:signal transduction histidine kinase